MRHVVHFFTPMISFKSYVNVTVMFLLFFLIDIFCGFCFNQITVIGLFLFWALLHFLKIPSMIVSPINYLSSFFKDLYRLNQFIVSFIFYPY